MTDKKKIELIEEVFDVDPGTLTSDMILSSMEEWNSLTKLSLIVMFDDECGKVISYDDIKKFSTIRDIMDIMD